MEDEEGRIGIFPSWIWLYVAVIAYTIVLILLLYLFTLSFDQGIQ
jgi:hypothetical protein